MSSLHAYLRWRGDLSFSADPLNEVDALLFSLLAYVDPPAIPKGGMTLCEAAAQYFFTHDAQEPHPLGLIVPDGILSIFRHMARTRRFENVRLCRFINDVVEESETQRGMQCAALEVRFPGYGDGEEAVLVAFRGTDDTLAGWRENFELSFTDAVPAQRRAATFLNETDLPPDAPLYVTGHSKGGNLAVYAAVCADSRVRRHIQTVFCHDGPGFSAAFLEREAYREIAPRIRYYLPEDSLVGLLLPHDEHYETIASRGHGLRQHDGLTWEVMGPRFKPTNGLSRRGHRSDHVISQRIAAMSAEEKRRLTDLLFSLLHATGARTLCELYEHAGTHALSVLRAYRSLPPADREIAGYLWTKLTSARVPTRQVRSPVRIHVGFLSL